LAEALNPSLNNETSLLISCAEKAPLCACEGRPRILRYHRRCTNLQKTKVTRADVYSVGVTFTFVNLYIGDKLLLRNNGEESEKSQMVVRKAR